jgi:branched-chain amino acid transport system substrate-binding protein
MSHGPTHSNARRQALKQVAGAAAASIAAPLWAQSAAKSVVLGQSAPFSGPATQLGEQFKRGALLYFDRLNARGGVNGRSIELKSLDDGYEPDRCKANTERLIKDGVFALFGYIGTPTSLAALPLATAAQVPFIAPFTGAQALREPFNRFAFHVRASYYDETAEIVKQVTSIGAKRIAVFHQNDSYGKAGLDGVVRALKTLSLEPAALGTVERNTVEVAAPVMRLNPSTKVLAATKPSMLL